MNVDMRCSESCMVGRCTSAQIPNLTTDSDNKDILSELSLSATKQIKAGEKAELKLIWKPSISLEQGLKVRLEISGAILYGA